ncbi:MAG: PIN domain nuclease [Aquabacterium sp.]|nr:PIN domain nuclease [Aquabacterium sp.]
MLVVDSGVWIDFFNGAPSPARATLRRLLTDGDTEIIVPDLVLFEVLRGFREERHFLQAEQLMLSLTIASTGGQWLAQKAAQHYRSLRAAGVTVRSAVDVLVAAFCIDRGYALLHADRDFDAFEATRGLRAWRH